MGPRWAAQWRGSWNKAESLKYSSIDQTHTHTHMHMHNLILFYLSSRLVSSHASHRFIHTREEYRPILYCIVLYAHHKIPKSHPISHHPAPFPFPAPLPCCCSISSSRIANAKQQRRRRRVHYCTPQSHTHTSLLLLLLLLPLLNSPYAS